MAKKKTFLALTKAKCLTEEKLKHNYNNDGIEKNKNKITKTKNWIFKLLEVPQQALKPFKTYNLPSEILTVSKAFI